MMLDAVPYLADNAVKSDFNNRRVVSVLSGKFVAQFQLRTTGAAESRSAAAGFGVRRSVKRPRRRAAKRRLHRLVIPADSPSCFAIL